MSKTIATMCYDLPTISRFFRSCALTIATEQTVSVQWTTYRDSSVLNAIYAVMFWKEPPGLAEVKAGSREAVERKTDELHERYLLAWIGKLALAGPGVAQHYVEDMVRLREQAKQSVQGLFRDVSGINAEVMGETRQAISELAAIKLSAQVGVAVIGAVAGLAFVGAGAGATALGLQLGASAGGFTAVGAANAYAHSLIRNWEGGMAAQVVGISSETGKIAVSGAGGALSKRALERALQGSAKSAHIIRSAEGEIAKYSARLSQEGLRKAAAAKAIDIVASRTAQVQAQTAAQAGFQTAAKVATRVGQTVPVVFAALDIWDAVADYRTTVAANR